MGKRKSKKEEIDISDCDAAEPETHEEYKPLDGTFKVEQDDPFVPDDVKLKRVKKLTRLVRIDNDKEILDFWLRHTLGLGTKQIKQLWKKLDEIYKVK